MEITTETWKRKGAEKLQSCTEKETGGDIKSISSPCLLCVLRASVVKSFAVSRDYQVRKK